MISMLRSLLFPLSVTIFVETIIYFFLRKHDLKLITTTVILNFLFNTTMNLSLIILIGVNSYFKSLAIFEVATVIVEALIIYAVVKTPFTRTFLFALLANTASLVVGLFFNFFWITPQGYSGIYLGFLFIFLTCAALYALFVLLRPNEEKREDDWY